MLIPTALALGGAAPGPIDLPGDTLFPESVSTLPNGSAFVGSVSGGVLRVSLVSGTVDRFIAPGSFESGSIYGVLADRRSGILWVCSNDFRDRGIRIDGAAAGSRLIGFDLRSGQGRIALPLPGAKSVCNDIAIDRHGAVYITDTSGPRIYRWREGEAALSLWFTDSLLESPRGGGLDGLAFAADRNLYVNNYRSGALFRIAIRSDGSAGPVVKLRTSRPLEKPDGMRSLGGQRLALAEGGGRISAVTISGDSATVEPLADAVVEPTGLSTFHQQIWFVSGQLSRLFGGPSVPANAPVLPFRLSPVRYHH
ncbi:SMP-30/gluconolactonase/LRE family protein [Rhizorhabdus dicambivorans]|uniref:SMP-30/gluconolactonase/LRE family protein n=1 Tax=Rhizorhabdus dicambivorans TaxID=1850238 RepID=UPI00082F4891|nr:hypothetical protein [Rhizorhabdus dicambivorans]